LLFGQNVEFFKLNALVHTTNTGPYMIHFLLKYDSRASQKNMRIKELQIHKWHMVANISCRNITCYVSTTELVYAGSFIEQISLAECFKILTYKNP
jgi:hypothetical protein